MRFVADINNMIGAAGIALACGIGWTFGCWLASRLLSILRF